MAWRVCFRLCCGQNWALLLCLTVSVMTVTLLLPLPPADPDQQSARALSSAGGVRSSTGGMELSPDTAFYEPLTHGQIHAWKSNTQNSVRKAKNSINKRSHTDVRRNKHKGNSNAFKRKGLAGTIPYSTSHPRLPEFTVSNTKRKHIIKPSNYSAVLKPNVYTYIHLERTKSKATHIAAQVYPVISVRKAVETNAGPRKDGHKNKDPDAQLNSNRSNAHIAGDRRSLEKHRQHSGKSDKADKGQQAVKKPSTDLKKHHKLSEYKKEPGLPHPENTLSRPETTIKWDDRCLCQGFREQDFPDSDHRSIRMGPDLCPVPWLSEDDIQKMELLAGGEVVSKARVPAHGQVLQVALNHPAHHEISLKNATPHKPGHRHPETHSESCQQGHCVLIKRTDDWFEVLAFHLDRVLGLNRSLPAVLRSFHSEILPYRYIRGPPRPVVWWDPDIHHLADGDNDQNSVPISWVQYQELLKVHCGSDADLRSAPCVGVHHSEWGRLALFDFLLQVNDRLDRYCCGFTPDPTELCVENRLYSRCANTKDLLLVHILVRKADPSRLVFIDNAGRPQQPNDNLNFRLVEGIDEFPEQAVSVLQSDCLESLLLRSLYTDREFWDSQGGADGIRALIRIVEHRGKILLRHIRDRELQPERDL